METLRTQKYYREWAKKFTLETWGKGLTVPVFLVTEGRAYGTFYARGLIKVNVQKLITKPFEGTLHEKVLDTLKHELCHWYCYNYKEQYKDGTKEFEEELLRVGASSTHNRVGEIGKAYQRGIIDGTITRNGNKNIKYEEIEEPKEYFEALFYNTNYSNEVMTWEVTKGYSVKYNNEPMGVILKVGKQWIAKGYRGYVSEYYWYTRKKLATEMVNSELEKRGEKLLVV